MFQYASRVFCHQLQDPHCLYAGPDVILLDCGNCDVNVIPLNFIGTHVPACIACKYRVWAIDSKTSPRKNHEMFCAERPLKCGLDAAELSHLPMLLKILSDERVWILLFVPVQLP